MSNIRITVEDYGGSIEYAIEVNGTLWAAGDCESKEDGFAKARALLASAGVVNTAESPA